MKKETLRMLLDTAKGLLQPDCVIKNGRIINVFTNTIEEGLDVVIKGGRVVSIERYIGDGAFCNQVKEIDVDGMFLCPGFI